MFSCSVVAIIDVVCWVCKSIYIIIIIIIMYSRWMALAFVFQFLVRVCSGFSELWRF